MAGPPLRFTFGLDLIRDQTCQHLQISDLDWVPRTVYQRASPLLQAEYRLGDGVMLAAGLRHGRGKLNVDDYTTLPSYGVQQVQGGELRMSETLSSLGAVWHVSGALAVYAAYAEGYNVADMGRILRAISRPSQRVEDLADLTPAVSDNRELDIAYDYAAGRGRSLSLGWNYRF